MYLQFHIRFLSIFKYTHRLSIEWFTKEIGSLFKELISKLMDFEILFSTAKGRFINYFSQS